MVGKGLIALFSGLGVIGLLVLVAIIASIVGVIIWYYKKKKDGYRRIIMSPGELAILDGLNTHHSGHIRGLDHHGTASSKSIHDLIDNIK